MIVNSLDNSMPTLSQLNLSYIKLPGYCIILVISVLAVMLPTYTQAQSCEESLRLSHESDELEANFGALGNLNDLNTYAWSFEDPCSNESCFARTGQNITVSNMFDVSSSTSPTIYLYEFSGSVDPGNEIGSTSKGINFSNDYFETDGDGDGKLESIEGEVCDTNPCDCDVGDDDDEDDTDDEDAEPPSDGLVNCGRQTEVVSQGDGTTTKLVNPCGYDDLINLISILIQWLIGILVLVATLMFTYAGFLYLLADGNSDKAQDAKEIFWNVVSGFAIVLVSVLFITTVVTMFTRSSWEDTWMDVIQFPELGMQVEELPEDDNVYS